MCHSFLKEIYFISSLSKTTCYSLTALFHEKFISLLKASLYFSVHLRFRQVPIDILKPLSIVCLAVVHNRRQKRQLVIKQTFGSCLRSVDPTADPLKYVKEGNCDDESQAQTWNLNCKLLIKFAKCFHFVTCTTLYPDRAAWVCKSVHKRSSNPICCDFICP